MSETMKNTMNLSLVMKRHEVYMQLFTIHNDNFVGEQSELYSCSE
jgi:hypothetical protein